MEFKLTKLIIKSGIRKEFLAFHRYPKAVQEIHDKFLHYIELEKILLDEEGIILDMEYYTIWRRENVWATMQVA